MRQGHAHGSSPARARSASRRSRAVQARVGSARRDLRARAHRWRHIRRTTCGRSRQPPRRASSRTGAEHGGGLHDAPRAERQSTDARDHRIADSRRNVAAGSAHLRDENGFPPVERCSATGSMQLVSVIAVTASSDSGGTRTSALNAAGTSPKAARTGCALGVSSSRYVPTRSTGRSLSRRPTTRRTSGVPSSAQ